MLTKLFPRLLLVAASVVGWTQTDDGGYIARTYTSGAETMPYRLFVPKPYNPQQQYPLVVWLSGVGGKGTDNLRQISGDQVPGTRLWVRPENQAAHPAFVVAPQSPWAWGLYFTSALEPDSRLVLGILDALSSEFSLDQQRIYLVGQSNGARAAGNLLINAPSRFVAAVLVAPAIGKIEPASDVAQTPIWIIQGAAPEAFPESARAFVKAMRLAGGNPRLTEYPGVDHERWTRAFAEPELVSWLFSQHR